MKNKNLYSFYLLLNTIRNLSIILYNKINNKIYYYTRNSKFMGKPTIIYGNIQSGLYIIKNKRKEDYLKLGIKVKIIEILPNDPYIGPKFIWNTDEQKILYKNDCKPGNIVKNMESYSEISKDMIDEINNNYYAIAIMPYKITSRIFIGAAKYYRFVKLEKGKSEIRNDRISEILND